MKKLICILLCLTAGIGTLRAQAQKAQLKLIGAAIGDSVVLRWAVANQPGWMPALVSGFILERTVLDSKNKVVGKPAQRLSPDTIHPWPYSSLETRMNRRDTFAMLAAQCLYGESMRTVQPADDFIGALQQAGDEADNRYGYAQMAADFSAHAADLLGLRWVDRDVKPGKKYLYTLYCAALDGQVWSDTAWYVIKPEEHVPLEPMPAPTLISGEKEIAISWKKLPNYSGYYVERSNDGVHFKRLNQTPYMDWTPKERSVSDTLSWIDSVGINYKPFYYRVSGISPFALVSPPGQVAKGNASDKTPPPAILELRAENPTEGVVELTWETPPLLEPLRGIVVARTTDPVIPYTWLNQEVLPAQTTRFTDKQAWPYGTNFYTVGLVDTAGNIAWSNEYPVVMTDFAPPAQPFGLQGRIDTAGQVFLSWNLGADPDLKGYQIYAANQADHAFLPLSQTLIEDTVFQYKIDLYNLTEHIYYKVKAFDHHLKASVFSEALEVKKPDIIPPDAPVFDDYKLTENGVYLHWRPASSKDLQSQRLLRRKSEGQWDVVAQMPATTTAYTDTLLQAGQMWEYALQAVDDAGLLSEPSFPIKIKTPPSGKKQGVTQLRGRWDEDKKRIRLDWELTSTPCERVLIYRGFNDGGLEMLQSAGQSVTHFEDPKTIYPGLYAYALRPIYPDGTEGPLTEIITIRKP
ncbi:MAG: fibronectin type III domain-containing protein [Saprospiraceae bacterium]|nr:fibronectin type III domain-containing protein [Saprospiraceae bacterium]